MQRTDLGFNDDFVAPSTRTQRATRDVALAAAGMYRDHEAENRMSRCSAYSVTCLKFHALSRVSKSHISLHSLIFASLHEVPLHIYVPQES